MATQLRILSSMATRHLLADVVAQFRQNHAQPITTESVGGVDAAKRVQAGESVDMVVLAADATAADAARAVEAATALIPQRQRAG